MPTLKRLVAVFAVILFVLLGVAQGAWADVAQPSAPPAADPTAGQVLSQSPQPVRPEDPEPDGGAPVWLWVVLMLAAGGGGSVAVLWWRGSQTPEGAESVLETTGELVAIGRGEEPPDKAP
jgi:hypothetical protein